MGDRGLHYAPYKHLDGKPLETYEELLIRIKKQTRFLKDLHQEDSISFFANTLYSETILMDKINLAVFKGVPMGHETIKESMNEISIGIDNAFEQYNNIHTSSLKNEVIITKTLRNMNEEERNKLLKKG